VQELPTLLSGQSVTVSKVVSPKADSHTGKVTVTADSPDAQPVTVGKFNIIAGQSFINSGWPAPARVSGRGALRAAEGWGRALLALCSRQAEPPALHAPSLALSAATACSPSAPHALPPALPPAPQSSMACSCPT
jgi:hypothetical protein